MYRRTKSPPDDANPPFFEVPANFWETFVRLHWNKEPVVLRNPFAARIATPEELYKGMARACDAYRRNGGALIRRVYIENTRVMTGVDDLLPRIEDSSLAGYTRRMSAHLEGRRFGVILNQYHRWDARHWLRVRDFLRGLFERVGLPPGGAMTDIFFGTYERTPFGIHKDTKHVFTWAIEGRKRVLLWPFETLRTRYRMDPSAHAGEVGIGTHDYSGIRDSAIVLEGSPGDLMYWPPSYWHIAEGVEGSSSPITLSLGLDEAGGPIRSTISRLHEIATSVTKASGIAKSWYSFPPPASRKGMCRLPSRITAGHTAVRRLLNSEQFERESRIAWMNWISGSGFTNFPAEWEELQPLRDDDVVRADARLPILWTVDGKTLECSVNGHGWTMQKTRDSLGALRYLERGPRGSVRELLREVPRASRHEFRGLLGLLHGYRWLLRHAES